MELPKVLIVSTSDEIHRGLAALLEEQCCVRSCKDGAAVKELLEAESHQVLVLDMVMAGADGIGVLQELAAAGLQPQILAMTSFCSDYVMEQMEKLGVMYVMIKPCDLNMAAKRIKELADRAVQPEPRRMEAKAEELLLSLCIHTRLDGFLYSRDALIRLAQEPRLQITKVIYPEIAKRYNCSAFVVERCIRTAIQTAWACRELSQWSTVIPPELGLTSRPSNGVFLSVLANYIRQRML